MRAHELATEAERRDSGSQCASQPLPFTVHACTLNAHSGIAAHACQMCERLLNVVGQTACGMRDRQAGGDEVNRCIADFKGLPNPSSLNAITPPLRVVLVCLRNRTSTRVPLHRIC
nr:hypothetical protein HmN_000953600 [Hymenolepis microstoma]CUU98033.1 hypothetical transcript [Hymenolepis microstoma]